MTTPATLIFLCGKMAAEKSTLAKSLAEREHAVLLVQDELLDHLFPEEITDIPGFVRYSSRLKNALGPHVCALLSMGVSVVLDFPGNTRAQRAWFRELFERVGARHTSCTSSMPPMLCASVSSGPAAPNLPDGAPWTTDAEFDAVTAYFQPPSVDEGFHVVRHERA